MFARPTPQRPRQPRIRGQDCDMFRHCFHVEFVDQQPGFAVDDGFRYAGVARCNDWQTGCGGLQNRNRGAFLSALA